MLLITGRFMENITDYYLSLIAGLASFFSPCILPLFPIYLSTLDGSIDDSSKTNYKIFLRSLLFVFSFCSVFVLLGLSATSIGVFLNLNKFLLLKVSGVMIIFFGVLNLFYYKFQVLNRNFILISSSSAKPVMLGLCFGLAWTPCVGPILASIITYSSIEKDYSHSFTMLALYSLGLGLPFILGSFGIRKIFLSFKNSIFFTKFYSPIMGIILILFGYLVYNNKIYILTIYVQKMLKNWE